MRPVTAVASMHLPVILKFNDKYPLFFYISHTAEKKDCLSFWMLPCAVFRWTTFLCAIYKITYMFPYATALVLTHQKFYYYQWGKALIRKKVKAGNLLSSIWAWERLLERNFIHKNVCTGFLRNMMYNFWRFPACALTFITMCFLSAECWIEILFNIYWVPETLWANV